MQETTRRKALLGTLGIGATALAGCVTGDGDDGPDEQTDDDDTDNGDDDNGADDDNPADIDPEVSIERVLSTCGDSDTGSVRLYDAEEGYHFEGTLSSPTPCYVPVIESTAFDQGTVTVTIDAAEEEQDGECVTCVGEIGYEGTITDLDPEEVDRIVIEHADGGSYEFETAEIPLGPPTLVETELKESSSRSRSSEDTGDWADVTELASVSEEDSGIATIDGGIMTNTPHYRAVIADAVIRGAELRIEIDVESTLDEGEMGTTELGVVEYTATANVESYSALEVVTVEHPESSHTIELGE